MTKVPNLSNKEFAKKLEKRTRDFAVRIIHLSQSLPNTPEARVIKTQMTKAGTSIGANYREANRSRSKADFRNKIKICETEASETQYWLEVIVKPAYCSIVYPEQHLETTLFKKVALKND